ncbi:mast cell protease 1A-like [Sorex araneus]|uniref:mast cell protease 1A-like n=1 Tax=Sorex araneus TaxID=42254 RepID=UPI002433432C|nr:mast cell protease 1A-like [Sorex araneus]
MLLHLLLIFALSPRAETGDIIGGHEAKPHSRPYMAYLNIYRQKSKKFECGGFLIQEDVVMTAAHCNGRKIEVLLGTNDVGIIRKDRGKKISVREAFPHEGYNKDTLSNDIMLLKLEKKVRLNNKINLLKLPDPQTRLEPGQWCSVAGWGQTTLGEKFSNKLMEVELRVQKEERCKRYDKTYNSTTQLCAGDKKGMNSVKALSSAPLSKMYKLNRSNHSASRIPLTDTFSLPQGQLRKMFQLNITKSEISGSSQEIYVRSPQTP